MARKFIVSGGGTSGHINPAITIADSLKAYYESKGEEVEIVFTGREQGLEGELVPKAGYKLINVQAKPFPMRIGLEMHNAIKALRIGNKQCRELISEFKPDAVIGTGGYVCAPLLMQARRMKVPTILHESNAFPGRANKLLARGCNLVLTGFPNQEKIFKRAKRVVFTGNPIRKSMIGNFYDKARNNLGIAPDEKLVFAMGGSLGAKSINEFIISAASMDEFKNVKFVLATGKQQTKKLASDLKIPDNLQLIEYIDNPQDYLCGADVCITRAGAVTCAEVAACGSCSVLVPYPHAAHDHQTFNARAFSDIGGAVMISDDELVEGRLVPILKDLLTNKKRRELMRDSATKLAVYDCSYRIVKSINETVFGE